MKIHFRTYGSNNGFDILDIFVRKYGQVSIEDSEVVVVIGGDGYLLETIHEMHSLNIKKPIYGMNNGTVGFLLNGLTEKNDLVERISSSKTITLNPIHAIVECGKEIKSIFGFNEIQLFRQSRQAANIDVTISRIGADDISMKKLACDGIIFSTAAGSTAYNRAAGGPIVPLSSNVIPLTPICAFRPMWKGALIPDNSVVAFKIIDTEKRPVSVVADSEEIRNISHVTCHLAKDHGIELLFHDSCLEKKVFAEQFIF